MRFPNIEIISVLGGADTICVDIIWPKLNHARFIAYVAVSQTKQEEIEGPTSSRPAKTECAKREVPTLLCDVAAEVTPTPIMISMTNITTANISITWRGANCESNLPIANVTLWSYHALFVT